MIPDEVVDRVRHAADIVEVIGEYVKLRRVGSDWRGPCPFHGGEKPNFAVSPKRGTYHCFVCHEGGDAIGFLRAHLGLDFVGAVKLLGEKVGIEVVDRPSRPAAPDPNEPAREVLAHAATWYQERLRDEAEGRDARAYLASRDLDADAIARFGLGLAPRDPSALVSHLATLGFPQERLLEAGLLVLREDETTPRPRFRGRIMFPIHDARGRVVGFGARALGDAQPKYLNSPESPVYRKRELLFGYHDARHAARRAERLLVVEGYLDAMRIALAGVDEVVAPLGTALTEEQAALIARVTPEVLLAYDGDEAGQRATFRAAHELLRHGLSVRVLDFPPGEDPDDFVRRAGREGLEARIGEALDVLELQIALLSRRGWFADVTHRRKAVDKLLPTVRAAGDEMMRALYVTRVAEALGVDPERIAQEAAGEARDRRGRGAAGMPPDGSHAAGPGLDVPPPDAPPPADGAGRGAPYRGGGGPRELRGPWSELEAWRGRRGRGRPTGPAWRATEAPPSVEADAEPAERDLVRLMLARRGLVEQLAERHGPDGFRHPAYRALFAALLQAPAEAPLGDVLAAVPADVAQTAEALLAEPADALDFRHAVQRLERRTIQDRIGALKQAIAELEGDAQRAALEELQALARELKVPLPSSGTPRNPQG